MSATANPADPLGFDMKVGVDLDPSGRSCSGVELVEDAMLHRLSCGRLLLTGAPDDQVEFGEDVTAWVGEALTQEELESRGPLLEEVIRRDPRIADATVAISLTTPPTAPQVAFTITVNARVTTGQNISRVVGVSAITVDFLAGGT